MVHPTRACFLKYANSSYNSIKEKQPNQNIGRNPKQTFLQRRLAGDLQAHEKILSIAN